MTKLLVLPAAMALLFPLLAVSSSAEDFDYYYLVQQWPGSYCSSTKQQCCFPDTGKPAADFTIHGLWPQYTVCRRDAAGDPFDIVVDNAARKRCRPGPADCDDGNPLSPWEIRDLLPDLNRNWPSFSCRNTAMGFWSHEWKKHGTCSGFGQHRYFESTLALKARHNLTAILAGAGIVPSDSNDDAAAAYHLSSVRDAIRDATGFEATVECNRGGGGVAQLYQVYLCVARDWSGLIDCPEPVNRKCTDKIKFPAF
ncbi:unnamed protein product [Urochloa humidicola]